MPVREHVRLSLCAGPRPTAAPDLPPRFCPKPAATRTVASRHWSGKLGSDHVLLAGCRDEEMSHEYRSPTNGVWYGAMTFYLLQKLQELHAQMSWREVYDAVQTQVQSVYARQIPQLEGPGNRAVFGNMTPHAGSYLNVIDASEAGDAGNDVTIRIGGGAAVGLTPGSHVELFPAGSGRPGRSWTWQRRGIRIPGRLVLRPDQGYTPD